MTLERGVVHANLNYRVYNGDKQVAVIMNLGKGPTHKGIYLMNGKNVVVK